VLAVPKHLLVVGSIHLTDINDADDAVLFTEDTTKWDDVLHASALGSAQIHKIGSKQRSKILLFSIKDLHDMEIWVWVVQGH